jgi:hypothetical protein
LTLRQLIGVAYHAICEQIGRDEADEVLARLAAEYEPSGSPYVSAAEQQARHELLRTFGMGGVTTSPA